MRNEEGEEKSRRTRYLRTNGGEKGEEQRGGEGARQSREKKRHTEER